MSSEARQKKYGKIRQGQKMLNFGASKPGWGGWPRVHPGSAPVYNLITIKS